MKPKELTAAFVADLYNAATDEVAWNGLALKVASTVGVEGGAVMLMHNGVLIDMSITDNIRAAGERYQAYYKTLDPWMVRAPRVKSGLIVLSSELYPESELIRSEFYNDFARPMGMRRPLNAYVAVDSEYSVGLGVEQPYAKRLLDGEDKPLLARVLPHLQKIVSLRLKLRAAQMRAELGITGLDALAFGAIICDGAGRVLFANSTAEAIAKSKSGLVLPKRSGTIGALSLAETQELAKLVREAANGNIGGALRLTGADGRVALAVMVTPLPANLGNHKAGHALVALRPIHDTPAFKEVALKSLFGLSAAQAKTALAIFDGKTPEEIAIERGLKISTVRTHLQEIFARADVDNQRDLIRLLATLPPLR